MLSQFAHAPWLTAGSGAATVLGGTMHRELIRGIFAAVLILLTSGLASAQFSTLGDTPARFEWRGRVSADYRSEFETKSDAGDEFHAWRTAIAGEFGGPINESILVSFGTRYAHSRYDFNLDFGSPPVYGTTNLPRDPWNSLNTIDFLPSTTILVGDEVSVVLALPIRYAGESGTDRNGFAAGVSALVRWQISKTVSVGLGLGVTSQLEKEAETFPIVALKWRIMEGLTLMTEGDWFQGGRTTLLWGTSNSIRFTISAGYERTRFRLDDNGTTADTNGIGEITTIPVEVGLRIRLMESAFLDVKTGVGIAGRIRVESDNGRKLYDQEFDPAPRVGIAITFPFGLPAR